MSQHAHEILSRPHLLSCECRICQSPPELDHHQAEPAEHHHPSLLGASIDDLEHLENEEAAQHFTPE